MMLINNEPILKEIEQELLLIESIERKKDVMELFTKDFSLRFCWSSNSIEGNTLSLDETVALIENDEVKSGHTFSEYQKAKNLYLAICNSMIPFHKEHITEEWIKENNKIIIGEDGEYRKKPVYIGSLAEIIFVPPEYKMVPKLMGQFIENVNFEEKSLAEFMDKLAKSHLSFERIHQFSNGNGRVGRMILNQQLINYGLLPIAIDSMGKYRQSFRRYDKNGDVSLLVHEICKAELESIQRVRDLDRKLQQGFLLEPNVEKEKPCEKKLRIKENLEDKISNAQNKSMGGSKKSFLKETVVPVL